MMCAPPQHKMGMSRHVMCKQQAEEWSGLVEYLSFASAASELAWPLALGMAGTKDGAEAEALGESVSLEAGDLPRKPGRLLPSLFHPALSCVAADATCAKLVRDCLKQHTAARHAPHLHQNCQCTSRYIWAGFPG